VSMYREYGVTQGVSRWQMASTTPKIMRLLGAYSRYMVDETNVLHGELFWYKPDRVWQLHGRLRV
jgi:hypothetical protein